MVSTQIQQQTDACSGRPVGRSKLSGQNKTTTLLPWTSVRPRLLWRFNTSHPLADRCSLDRNQRRSEQNAVSAVRNLLDGGGDCNWSPLETCESLVCDVCVDAGSIPANSTNLASPRLTRRDWIHVTTKRHTAAERDRVDDLPAGQFTGAATGTSVEADGQRICLTVHQSSVMASLPRSTNFDSTQRTRLRPMETPTGDNKLGWVACG